MSDKLTAAKSKTGDRSHTPANDRRDFIRKGALAAPLIASVASRPVWACSVSGHMSGNLSHHSADACTAPANCMNWSYWAQWLTVYDYVQANLTISKADFKTYVNNNSDHPFKIRNKTSPINALYNWSLADTETSGALAPTDGTSSGMITAMGNTISDMSDPTGMRFVAGLLNAAHPDIQFPYGSNPWTAQYILDNYSSIEDADTLDDLLDGFFSNTIEPAGLAKISDIHSRWGAFQWARSYLFGIT